MVYNLENATLKSVLETMVDGVIIINNLGIIQSYNSACDTIFGYAQSEVLGENISILMPEPDQRRHDGYIENYRKTGTAKIIGIGRQVLGKRKNGDIFPMYLSVGENKTEGQDGYVGIIRDVTAEVEKSEKYKVLQQEYFHISRIAAMNELGTAIAHELNQPLAAIMNYIQAAKLNLVSEGDIDKDRLQNIMEKSADQVDRASETLAVLRRFIQSGELDKKAFYITDILDNALSLAAIGFETDKSVISYKSSENLPQVFGSDVQIQQVLVNLIRNAFEAIQDKETQNITLSVELSKNNDVKVGVVDSGIGFSNSSMQNIFETFSSTKKNGLGVGLSISQSIISNHGGRLWAEHNHKGGAAFYFTLPRVEE